MESLKLKRIARQLKREENIKLKSKFNFGVDSNGRVITSTANPKAHTYNRLIRESNALRDKNFNDMLIAYQNGEVSTKEPKYTKACKRFMYRKSIEKANKTREMINEMVSYISETYSDPIYLCQAR